MKRKPKTKAKFWLAHEIPEEERKFALDRANHVEGAETIAKPLRDGELISLGVLHQDQMRGGELKRVRAGITGTRCGYLSDEQLVQLPLDAWSASNADFMVARMQQLTRNRKLTKGTIGSLIDAKRRIDFKAHEKMSFDMMEKVADDDLTEFLEYSQGEDCIPWVRSPHAGMVFRRPTFVQDEIMRMMEGLINIARKGGGVYMHKSWKFGFNGANDNEPTNDGDEDAA